MEVLNLKNPYVNGFIDKEDPVALQYFEKLQAAYKALDEGRLYARFIDGDRKGSVAKLTRSAKYVRTEPSINYSSRVYFPNHNGGGYRFEGEYLYTTCSWKGRRNKVQLQVPHRDVELIIGDDIETVWALFDAKAAKEEILKDVYQHDIDGKTLEVGDRVMYINLRYGAGGALCRGKIKEFKVTVNSSSKSITTIIKGDTGEESALKYPHYMVSKIG